MFTRPRCLSAHLAFALLGLVSLALAPRAARADCDLPCSGRRELEACGANSNGGCVQDRPEVEPIVWWDSVCGTLWADASTHDVDWYELEMPESGLLLWSVTAEIPIEITVFDANQGCSGATVLASTTAPACVEAFLEVTLYYGTYWLAITTPETSGYPCPINYVTWTWADFGPPWYCGAGAENCDEYIQRVQLETIDNSSGCGLGGGLPGYSDYSAISTDLVIGRTYQLIVTNGNPVFSDDTCGAWIDWNGDMYFDAPEDPLVIAGSPGPGPYTATFAVPPGAAQQVRLRIRIDRANDPYYCFVSDYGEVEDYTLVIRTPGVLGDLNCDAYVNAFDIDPFIECLVNYMPTPPCVSCYGADIDQSGWVDAFDIDPFVACLRNQGCP